MWSAFNVTLKLDAVLITGGKNLFNLKKVEMFHLVRKRKCILPDMLEYRHGHTSVGGVICGGGEKKETKTSCISFNPTTKSWHRPYEPISPRIYHVAWNWTNFEFENSFTLLGGGRYSQNIQKTEVVFNSGKVTPGEEDLKYPIQ